MKAKRRTEIENLLERGGAINQSGDAYGLCHPSKNLKLKESEVTELLNEGSLVVINCGCAGFWWALRPDLVAMRSASRFHKAVAT